MMISTEILKHIRDNFETFYWGDSQPDSATMGSIMGSYLTFEFDSNIACMRVSKTIFSEIDKSKTFAPDTYNMALEGFKIIERIIMLAKDKNSEDDYDTEKIAYTEKYINENFAN